MMKSETVTYPDRIKLPFVFDAAAMTADIESLLDNEFVYYDSIPLRAPAHLVDPTIPFPPPADDYADGSWTQWKDTDFFQASPYLNQVVDTFRDNTSVTLVRLLRLAPGAVVKEHTDPTLGLEIERSVIRVTIPITSSDRVSFYLNNEVVPMRAGECWYMRLTDPHKVVNESDEQRINMTIDIRPNEWIRSILMS